MNGRIIIISIAVFIALNSLIISPNNTKADSNVSFEFNFVEGWNCITIPLNCNDNTFGGLFGDYFYDATIDQVLYSWDADAQVFRYHSSEEIMYPGVGYFIYSYENFVCSITGSTISSDLSINLYSSNNLLGWIHEEAIHAEDIYETIVGCSGVSINVDASRDIYLTYTPGNPENNFEIRQGMGFWVTVSESSVWDGSIIEEEPTKQLVISSSDEVWEESYFTINVYHENATVDAASVIFNGDTYYTDSNGEATLYAPSVSEDSYYTITASKSGYINDEETILVKNKVSTNLVIDIDFDTVSESTSFGFSILCNGDPVDNVTIGFNGGIYYTNSYGQVNLISPSVENDAQYLITAYKTGYIPDEKYITVINDFAPPNETEPQNLLIHSVDNVYESTLFQVYVTSENNSIGNVTIGFNDQIYHTDQYGFISLTAPSVSEGTLYNITASKIGYTSDEKWINVLNENESGTSPSNGWIYGRVIYKENESYLPIENVRVHVIVLYSAGNIASKSTITDRYGLYNLSIFEGAYTLEFSKNEFMVESVRNVSVTNGQGTELNVVLKKGSQTSPSYLPIMASSNTELIDEAIQNNSVGGEVIIQLNESKVKYDKKVIIYDGVAIDPIKVDEDGVSLIVNGDENSGGRTIIVNLEEGIFDSSGDVIIEYDGEIIKMADDINDVLNPNDDGSNPEYILSKGSEGIQILISIPHFSEHHINIYEKIVEQVTETVMKYKEYAIAFAMLVILIAAIVIIIKGREDY